MIPSNSTFGKSNHIHVQLMPSQTIFSSLTIALWFLATRYHISKYWHLAKWKRQDKEKKHFVLLTFLSRCQGDLKRGQSLGKIKRMFPFIVSPQKWRILWSKVRTLTLFWSVYNVTFLLAYTSATLTTYEY